MLDDYFKYKNPLISTTVHQARARTIYIIWFYYSVFVTKKSFQILENRCGFVTTLFVDIMANLFDDSGQCTILELKEYIKKIIESNLSDLMLTFVILVISHIISIAFSIRRYQSFCRQIPNMLYQNSNFNFNFVSFL